MSEETERVDFEALREDLRRSQEEVIALCLALEKERARAAEAHRQMRSMRESPGWRLASAINQVLRAPGRLFKAVKRTLRDALKSTE